MGMVQVTPLRCLLPNPECAICHEQGTGGGKTGQTKSASSSLGLPANAG